MYNKLVHHDIYFSDRIVYYDTNIIAVLYNKLCTNSQDPIIKNKNQMKLSNHNLAS